MARLSRLLSAVSLGIAVTAAVGAVAVGIEYAHVHRAPAHLAESSSSARIIVKFKERSSIMSASNSSTRSASVGSGPQKASVLGGRLGLALTDGRILGERTQVLMGSGMTSSALAATVAGDTDVEWAEIDHKRYIQAAAVNDPLYPDNLTTTTPNAGQWYLRAPGVDASGHTVASSINIEPAWAITHGSTSIVIGDVDTGITAHPDLDSKMLTGYDFIADVSTANDGGGRDSDPSDPGDYVTAAENSNKTGPFYGCNDDGTGGSVAENSSWHGTQTAGILGAATNNGIGMAGTAYNVPIIAARALGKCGGYDSDIIAAAQWAGGIPVSGVPTNAHPARVINMSLGGDGACTQAYIDALTALRNNSVLVFAAAGNGDANDEGIAVATPANCKPATSDTNQTPIVVAVAALRQAGTKVGFSNLGREVTISAPGGNCVNTSANEPCLYPILTTVNSGTTSPISGGGTYTTGFGEVSLGTSFSTPLAAGTAALMLSVAPNLTNAQVIGMLKSTARPFPTTSDSGITTVCQPPDATPAPGPQDECICTTTTCGAGMLDAGAALAAALPLSTGTPPTASISPATAATVVAGSTVTLDGSASAPGSAGGALTYQWAIIDSDTFVTLGSTSGSSLVVTGTSAGTAQIMLRVTDSRGITATAATSVTVTAATSTGTGTGSTSSGGGGGGAANPGWLAALAIAGLLLRPRTRRTRA